MLTTKDQRDRCNLVYQPLGSREHRWDCLGFFRCWQGLPRRFQLKRIDPKVGGQVRSLETVPHAEARPILFAFDMLAFEKHVMDDAIICHLVKENLPELERRFADAEMARDVAAKGKAMEEPNGSDLRGRWLERGRS